MRKEVLKDWVRKAEADYRAATREGKVERAASYDVVCILSQQCAEKYLKAFLVSYKTRYPWSHDLLEVLNRCVEIEPSFEFIRSECTKLSSMFRLRYPADFADRSQAQLALQSVKTVRSFVRAKLGLAKPRASRRDISHG